MNTTKIIRKLFYIYSYSRSKNVMMMMIQVKLKHNNRIILFNF